jgi:hypothetical protein
VIQIKLTDASIKQAIKDIRDYKLWVEQKEIELRKRLAELGADVAEIRFTGAKYDGDNDVTVRVDTSGSTAVIYAEGTAVLFIEFGSGAKFGYGHPMANQLGYGPSTWSEGPEGAGHWDNPDGWYYKHGKKSEGNPPAQAMLSARDEIIANIPRIAREVFRH